MKTQVEFRSEKFPPYPGEEEEINPGLQGKHLSEYLVEKLNERGIATEPLVAEDWGWYLPVKNEGFRLALCCGHQYGDDDQFLVFTDPVEPTFRKLFKTIDASPQLTRFTAVLDEILGSDPEIKEIVWG